MGLFSKKKISLPEPPSFWADPAVGLAKGSLLDKGAMLTSPTEGGLPEILRPAVSTSPEITQLVLQGLRASTSGDLRDSRQSIINTLEANNQLTGSTTASALGNLESDYLQTLVAAGAEAGIADINRALENRLRLYTTGLQATESAGNLGLNDQSQRNQFNLADYENRVAKTLAEEKSKGSGLGAAMGGAGGWIAGMALAPGTGPLLPMLLGGLGAAGGYESPGTGGAILGGGAGLAGQKFQAPVGSSMIGGGLRNANTPMTISTPYGESITDNLRLAGNRYGMLYGGLN